MDCGGRFLYILNVCVFSVFVIVKSKKFILLLTSFSEVKFNFGFSCIVNINRINLIHGRANDIA